MKKRKPIIFILIAFVLVILYLVIATLNNNKLNKNDMLNDAKLMITLAKAQNLLDETEGKGNDCLYIYGYDGAYSNSGNYIGSIDLTLENPYIWLSDGNYFVRGTTDDLTIMKSNLAATTNCNK